MTKPFTHLQVHSEYSFLQAPVRIQALLKRAEALEQNAIALTDHGFMFGILDFYMMKGPKDEEIAVKRILGSHIYIETDSANPNDKSSYNRLTLLAKNQDGYKNLVKIVSENYTDEKYQEIPAISLDFLASHKDGLFGKAQRRSNSHSRRLRKPLWA